MQDRSENALKRDSTKTSVMENDSSNEEKDVKPIIFPNITPKTLNSSSPKKWSPRLLHDGNRKSAFQPYKQAFTCNTVLTNLQRGNTKAETPVPQATDINFHTRAGQGEITKSDIVNERDVDVCDSNGLTALHWASAYGQYNAVQLLLDADAEVNKLGPEEETALILAASGGHHEVVRLLLSRGAELDHPDHLCNTALMYAAKGNHPHTCQELLLNGASFALVNFNDVTAHDIAIENHSSLAQAVIRNFIISRLESPPPVGLASIKPELSKLPN